ncbi:MAG TPA: hypothetical protein VGK74_24040 [Symbiobacteriaceae bacterium]
MKTIYCRGMRRMRTLMMSGVGSGVEEIRKPPFTTDQILSGTDVVRKWREKVEPRLSKFPYVLVFTGSEPRTTVMPYLQFESLWQRAEAAAELELKMEVLSRVLHLAVSGDALVSLEDAANKLGITAEELEAEGDVEIESE